MLLSESFWQYLYIGFSSLILITLITIFAPNLISFTKKIMTKKYISKTAPHLFNYLEEKYDAKFPVIIYYNDISHFDYSISKSSPLYSDNKNFCIFFSKFKLIVIGIETNDILIEIPFRKVETLTVDYWKYTKDFHAVIHTFDHLEFSLFIENPSKSLRKAYGNLLFFDDFIHYMEELKTIYISDIVIPFFEQIKTEYQAKFPIIMREINSIDFTSDDENSTCIFLTYDYIIIKSLFNPQLEIKIPISEIKFINTFYNSSHYHVSIEWINDSIKQTLSFNTCDITSEIKNAYKNHLFVKDFINALEKLKESPNDDNILDFSQTHIQ